MAPCIVKNNLGVEFRAIKSRKTEATTVITEATVLIITETIIISYKEATVIS